MSTPSTPSPLATPEPWGLVAQDYALEITPMFEQFAEEALRIAEVGPDTRVADVAAGPGTLALLAARRGARVKALDFSAPMIEILRARLAGDEVERVVATVGDGQALPWQEGEFDAAFSMFGLMFFPDRAAGFRELARVLRPGGIAVVSSWVPMERIPAMATAFATLEELMPGPKPPARAFPLVDAASGHAEMTAGGFHDVTVTEFEASAEAPSIAEFAASLERTTAPIALAKRRLGDAWPPIRDALRDRLVARFGDGPQHMTMIANMIVGRR